jgi:WD40 repeat protein
MRGLALSADGERVIVCRSNNTLETWDLATETKHPTVILENNTVGENDLCCVAFTADRRRVLGGQWSGAIRLWDAKTGKVVQNYLGHTQRIRSVALSPDETRIASASQDGSVRIWEVENARELISLNGEEKGIGTPTKGYTNLPFVFSPDGGWILSGGWDGTVRLWDVKTGKELRRYIGHTECVRGVAISPDGRLAASASDDKTIRLWKLP